MAYEIYRTNATVSGQSASVRANYDVRTGGQAVGAAIAGAGSVLQQLGEKWDLQEANTQLSRANMLAEQEHNRLKIELPKLPPDQHKKAYEKSLAIRRGFMPKNPKAQAAYINSMNNRRDTWDDSVEALYKFKVDDNSRSHGYLLEQEFVTTGTPESSDAFLKHFDDEVRNGTYSQEESVKRIQQAALARARQAKTQMALADEHAKNALEEKRERNRDTISELIRKGMAADSAINASALEENEQWQWFERQRAAIERRQKGEEIITNISRKQDILDMIATIHQPGGSSVSEIKKRAYDGRYRPDGYLDDTAYDEVRDALRREIDDKIPFTEAAIEKGIGELMTRSPSSILGLPMPTLRNREDALKYAINTFGRFYDRIPGVMETINAVYPPDPNEKRSATNEPKGESAYNFKGDLIGSYNPNGSITLNAKGVRELLQIAGGNIQKANEIALENRYVIPRTE